MKKAKKILTLVACAVLLICLSVGATLAYLTSQTEIVTNTFTVGDIEITLDEAKVKLDDNDNYVADGNERIYDSDENSMQSYKLHPGIDVLKDPTIRLDATSENCYIVAKIVVSVDDGDKEGANTIAGLRDLLSYEDSNGLIGFKGIVNGGVMDETFGDAVKNDYKDEEGNTVTNIYYSNDNVYLTQTVDGDTNVFYVYWKAENLLESGEENYKRKLIYPVFEHINIPTDYKGDDMAKLAGLNIEVQGFAVQADGFKGVVDAFKAAFPGEYATAGLPVEG